MMINRLCYILFSLFFILECTSCSLQGGDPVIPRSEEVVSLVFSVMTPSGADESKTRAELVIQPDDNNYFQQSKEKYENINTLRVIIVRPDGEVEHNRLFKPDADGIVRYTDLEFPVVSGEKKLIYLFANCEEIGFELIKTLKPGDYYTRSEFESFIITADDGVLYNNTGETKHYIPISEVHEVYVFKPNYGEEPIQNIGSLFITRAAVKFTFNIKSDYNSGLYLKEIVFNGLADQEYLLPCETTYFPKKSIKDGLSNPTGFDDVAGRFITDYKIPDNTTHRAHSFIPEGGILLSPTTVVVSPEIYFCESKIIDIEHLSNPYSISVTVGEKDGNDNFVDGSLYTFTPKYLENLPILPRNTHVLVNMIINRSSLEMTVTLQPYLGVTLNPWFGLE